MYRNWIKKAVIEKDNPQWPRNRLKRRQCDFCFSKFDMKVTCQARFCSPDCKKKYTEARKNELDKD